MHADKLPITGPCPIDLDAIGFDRSAKVAHCTHCTKNVTVLSNMTRGEAREFMRVNKGKKMCVSYSRDERGRIRFAPEPAVVPVERLRARPSAPVVPVSRLRARPARAGMVAAFGLTAALAACTPHSEAPSVRVDVVVTHSNAPAPKTTPPRTGDGLSKRIQILTKEIETPPQKKVETIEVPEIDPVPLAGAAVIPHEEMLDGEMEVPDPDAVDLDEPCALTGPEFAERATPKGAAIRGG